MPDAIVYPTGGGTGIVGMWKAFAELEAMGLIGPERPKMIVVQAEGCAPIVERSTPASATPRSGKAPQTAAPGLRVPVAIGDYLILDAVRASGGTALTVTDAELIAGMHRLARTEGIFVSPGGRRGGRRRRAPPRERAFSPRTTRSSSSPPAPGLKHVDLI